MECEERAADPLAGGLMHGYQCGAVWGAALAAGAQAHRLHGNTPEAEARAIRAAQGIVESFRARNKSLDCREITGIDLAAPNGWAIAGFLARSLPSGTCFGMVARNAPATYKIINSVLPDDGGAAYCSPVSCAALLVRRVGLSDRHAVMAAGFAGGIGLSGAACGALGAAIWIVGMKNVKSGIDSPGLNVPGVQPVFETFLQSTRGACTCSGIVGRKFKNAREHAEYVFQGGCAQLIEDLAARLRS
jgi:hypothetical protein